MTLEPFTYEEYEKVRKILIELIWKGLTAEDKDFLLQFNNPTPDWEKYYYDDFPYIRWKLLKLERLKQNNSNKFPNEFIGKTAFRDNLPV